MAQVSWNDLKPYQSYTADTISMPEIKMGNNSANNVSGVTTFNLCKMAGHALYCTKFCEIISNSIKVIEQTPFLYWKLQRGIIPQKNVGGATVVNLCMSSGHLCQVTWNNIKRYQSYRVSTISIRKITKGNNSAKNAGGATVVNLCTSYDHALYFYQVLWNYLKRYQSYRVDTISILKITKGNNSAKMYVEWLLLIFAPRLVMLYISTMFCDIISNGIKVIERTKFLYWKIQRGIILPKM